MRMTMNEGKGELRRAPHTVDMRWPLSRFMLVVVSQIKMPSAALYCRNPYAAIFLIVAPSYSTWWSIIGTSTLLTQAWLVVFSHAFPA